jgi:hypothetical protein
MGQNSEQGPVAPSLKIYRVEKTRGRVALGDLVHPDDLYRAEVEPDGVIVLTPVVIVDRPTAT